MANIDDGFNAGEIITIDDVVLITQGANDPSTAGYEAPVGSLYLRTTGSTYQKTDVTDTDWTLFEAGAAGSHNTLSGLQGGTSSEYYHLTNTEHTNVLSHLTDSNNPHTTTISSLDDTLIVVPTNGQLLRFVGTASPPYWENYTETHFADVNNPHNTTVDNLDDTFISSVMNNEALVWNSAASPPRWENQLVSQVVPGSGVGIQVKFGPILGVSGTETLTIFPAPIVTDGVELWSDVITPTSTDSLLRISSSVLGIGSNSSTIIVVAVFRDSILMGATELAISKNNTGAALSFTFYDEPNTGSEITYSCRVGKDGGGTWYINQLPGVATNLTPYLEANSYTIEEIGVVP